MFNEHDYVQNLFRIESFALIVVDFSVPEPSTTVSVVEVENMSYRTIAHLTVYLEQQLT